MPQSAMPERLQTLERIADFARNVRDLEPELVGASNTRLTTDRLREARRELDEALEPYNGSKVAAARIELHKPI